MLKLAADIVEKHVVAAGKAPRTAWRRAQEHVSAL